MSQSDPIRALIDAGDIDAAVAQVEKGARAGDADSLLRLADWRLYGLYGPQDFAAAQAALAQAASAGSAKAGHMRAYLTAAGIGCAPDFDRAMAMLRDIGDPAAMRQLRLLDRAPSLDHAMRARRTVLNDGPLIVRIAGFALPEECD